jgi:hypothetical protein
MYTGNVSTAEAPAFLQAQNKSSVSSNWISGKKAATSAKEIGGGCVVLELKRLRALEVDQLGDESASPPFWAIVLLEQYAVANKYSMPKLLDAVYGEMKARFRSEMVEQDWWPLFMRLVHRVSETDGHNLLRTLVMTCSFRHKGIKRLSRCLEVMKVLEPVAYDLYRTYLF